MAMAQRRHDLHYRLPAPTSIRNPFAALRQDPRPLFRPLRDAANGRFCRVAVGGSSTRYHFHHAREIGDFALVYDYVQRSLVIVSSTSYNEILTCSTTQASATGIATRTSGEAKAGGDDIATDSMSQSIEYPENPSKIPDPIPCPELVLGGFGDGP
ncbi:hypothetical protein ACRALDRAFT_1059547 [Sodiomyces alcalophilus JCM 7366]|uniref:uncharacterized protein n=1 Tax=Sodiomyces alcalophilus JCM 7366 TaxID=591952 RepID=UPI0039B4BEE5